MFTKLYNVDGIYLFLTSDSHFQGRFKLFTLKEFYVCSKLVVDVYYCTKIWFVEKSLSLVVMMSFFYFGCCNCEYHCDSLVNILWIGGFFLNKKSGI